MKKLKKVFIIAEAGVNHNGSFKKALQLVDTCKKVGADAIKFQTWKTEKVLTKNSPKPSYQKNYLKKNTQFEILKNLELSFNDFKKIKKYCDKKKILFLSTADEIESANFLRSLQPFFKIGSAELTDIPFLRKISKFKKPLIISTGMSNNAEIGIALKNIINSGLKRKTITLMHCNSAYPTPSEDVNLKAIKTLKKKFKVQVGFSDHTVSTSAPLAAVTMGAKVIEKHITLSRKLKGPDHSSSLEPKEFKFMISQIREVEKMLGRGLKKMSKSEKINLK
jgi:Sialic acid synthase